MNKIANVKMTPEANTFLRDYTNQLYAEINKGRTFINNLSKELTLKEHLKAISPFIIQISERQDNKIHYLPCQVMTYFIIKKLKPQIAVETGVEKGGTTLAILEAMRGNEKGRLFSIDIEKNYKFHGKYVSPIAPLVDEKLKDRWTFVCGDAQAKLEDVLSGCNEIDFFLAGQSHTYEIQKQEGEIAWKKLASGGVFILDRPDFNDYKYQKEFIKNHSQEIDWYDTYPEGRAKDSLMFTVFLKI